MLRSGAKLTGISYRSGGESVTAVLSKAVAVTFENVAILAPLIRDGKVRALAVANKRWSFLRLFLGSSMPPPIARTPIGSWQNSAPVCSPTACRSPAAP